MPQEEVRYMWLFVFFDLPVGTKEDRRRATRFRQFLVNDGYEMLQFSIYTRLCRGQDTMEKHIVRVQRNLPPRGSIRTLPVTDRQYGRMKILVGERKPHESVATQQLILL